MITRYLTPRAGATLSYFVRFDVNGESLLGPDRFSVMTIVRYTGAENTMVTDPHEWVAAFRAAEAGLAVVADTDLRHARPLNPRKPNGPTDYHVLECYLVDLATGARSIPPWVPSRIDDYAAGSSK